LVVILSRLCSADGPGTVLIVEDDGEQWQFACAILGARGYGNARHDPADLVTPEMDGFKPATALQANSA